MKLTYRKLCAGVLTTKYKLAGLTGNVREQQNLLEELVLLHTQMRVEQEQDANKLLFDRL